MSDKRQLGPDVWIDEHFMSSLTLSPELLEEELVKLPAHLAYYNELYAQAIKRHGRAKQERDMVHARISTIVRAQLADEAAGVNDLLRKQNPKVNASELQRVTEAQVEATVELDEEYRQVRLMEIEADAERSRMYGVMESLRAKREAVIALVNLRRAEMVDPAMRDFYNQQKQGRDS